MANEAYRGKGGIEMDEIIMDTIGEIDEQELGEVIEAYGELVTE